jgi:ribosomal protein L7/L12
MKFDLEIENEVGCIAITLDKDFVEGEMEAIVKLAKSLLKKKPTRDETLAWAKTGEPTPSVLAWAGATTYYKLEFLNPPNKIVAIREIRSTLGCGLKEAKDIVENTTPCPPLSVHNAILIKDALARAGVTEYSLTEVER